MRTLVKPWIALALACVSCGGKSESPTGPTTTAPPATPSLPVPSQECRNLATAFTIDFSQSAPIVGSSTMAGSCTFDRAAVRLTCNNTERSSSGCSSNFSQMITWASVSDVVDEGMTLARTLSQRVSGEASGVCPGGGGLNTSTQTHFYDGQGRLIRTESSTVAGPTTATTTHLYTAWDSQGRPTVGTISSNLFPTVNLRNSYNDQARTVTYESSPPTGGTSTQTMTFDGDGNQLIGRVVSGPLVSTSTQTTTATTRICK